MNNGLSSGNTIITNNSKLASGPTLMKSMINSSGLAGGKTMLKSGPTMMIGKGTKNRGQTNLRTGVKATTTQNTDGAYAEIKIGDKIVTPKPLIIMDPTGGQLSVIKEQERLPSRAKGTVSQMIDSSMRPTTSLDQSSDSGPKQSTSNLGQTSMMESKMSDKTDYSDEESSSRHKAADREKKKNKDKGIDLDENVIVHIGETPTITLFSLVSYTVTADNPNYSKHQKASQQYDQLLKTKIGSATYGERHAQTFNYAQKYKEQQTQKIGEAEMTCEVTEYDLFDAELNPQKKPDDQTKEEIRKAIEKEMEENLKNPLCLIPTNLASLASHSQNKYYTQDQQSIAANTGNPNKIKEEKRDGDSQVDSNSSMSATKTGQLTRTETSKNPALQQDKSGNQHQTRIPGASTLKTTKGGKDKIQVTKPVDVEMYENLGFLKDNQEEVQPTYSSELEQKILTNPSLLLNLKYVERILNEKFFHKEYVIYRNYPEISIKHEQKTLEGDNQKRLAGGLRNLQRQAKAQEEANANQAKEEKTMSFLFKFSCDKTKNRTVSAVDWNAINKDLLAASYGEYELTSDREGYLMFWTLKNPNYPERIIKTPSKAMTCQFSPKTPNLIAAGMYNGVVAIYDTRIKGDKPIADSKLLKGKHIDTVWETHWVSIGGNADADKGENLYSISSDGRIVEWSLKKGLEYTDIMFLKRQANPNHKEEALEGMNFSTAGFSLDFMKQEGSMYLASTENGTVHKCSKSYKEQYLENYFGHTGPVYKVRCNPFSSDFFLTASADWTCKLWNWKEEACKYTFQTMNLCDEIMDIDWNPWMSTMFARVARDGRCELWDIAQNLLDPIATDSEPTENEKFPSRKTCKFCPTSPILVTGDIAGDVNIYRINGFDDYMNMHPLQQEERLIKAIYPNDYSKHLRDNDKEAYSS